MADGRVEYEIRADDSKLDEDLKKSEEKMQKSAEKTAEKQKSVEEKTVENTEKSNNKKVESTENANQKIVESTEKAQEEIVNRTEDAADKAHHSVESASKKVQKSTDDVKNKAVSVATAVGKAFAAIVTAATTAGTAAVMSGASAESSYAKVKTMLSGNDLNQYYDDLMSLSNETGVSFENLSEAMYQALSAGVSQDKAIEFVKSSVSLSKGGFTEVATAIDVVTTAINAYGLSMEDATHIQDVLIMTQNKGKTTVDELASNMGKIIPTANSLNVSLDQLGAMYATITANGVATAESTTYMNSMLNELASSSSIASKALEEAAGRTFKQLTDEGKTVAEILQMIDVNAKQSGKSMTDMFGSAEAAKAAQIIVDKTASFNNNLNAMADSAGAAETAAATMMDTLGEKINVLVANGKNLLTELGNELAPIVEKTIETIESNLPAVEELLQDFAPVIGSLLMQLVELATGVLPELLDTIKPIMEFVVSTVLPNLIDLIKFVIQFKDVMMLLPYDTASWIANNKHSGELTALDKAENEAKTAIAQYETELKSYYENIGDYAEEAASSIVESGNNASTATDSFATSAKSAAQTVSDLTAEMNELSTAFAEQNESGQLSIDATMKLIDSGYSAILMIDEETGAVRINAEAYRDLAKAKIEEKEATLRAARADAAAAYGKKIESAGMMHDAKGVAEAQAAYNAAVSEYDLQLAALGQLKDGIGNVVSGTYSSHTPGGVKKDTASSNSSSKSTSSTSGSSSSSGSSGSSASGGNLISITSYIPTVWDSESESYKKLRKSNGLTNISKSGQIVSINGGAESNVSTKSSKAVGGSASAYETTIADVVKAVNSLKKSQDEMKITVTSILQCDKRTLAKVTAEGINEIKKSTGKSPLQ